MGKGDLPSWTLGFFVFPQDMCVVCGSFGRGAEGHLLACSQCSQCYHPYCVNSKVSSEPKRPGLGNGVTYFLSQAPTLLKVALDSESHSSVTSDYQTHLGGKYFGIGSGLYSFLVVDHELLV